MPTDLNPPSSPPLAPPPRPSMREHGSGAGARLVSVALSAWLFLSAFLLPHGTATRTNTWMVGLLCTAFGMWAFRAPVARFVTTALSLWLFFSTVTLFHRSERTVWNNLVIALLLFVASLIPSRSERTRGGRTQRLVEA